MRRALVVLGVLCVVGVGCTTSTGGGGGGGGGSSEGAGYPPCTAKVKLASTTPVAQTPPTIVDDPPTDLRLETPAYGYLTSRKPVISADGTKLLVKTQGQAALPGGFSGDAAWVSRDLTTGQNTLVMPTKLNRGLFYPDTAAFLPDGSVAFNDLGWWLPLAPDQSYGALGDTGDWMSQVFRWDVNTHEYSNLSLGPDGNPIAVSPPGTNPAPTPQQGPEDVKVSADGRYVFFSTKVSLGPDDPPGRFAGLPNGEPKDLFRRDTVTGDVVKIDVGNHPELGPSVNGGHGDVDNYTVSEDGRYVAFAAPAMGGLAETGFCPNGDLVFLRDIDAGTTTLVSQDPSGVQRYGTDPHISADGQTVTYSPFEQLGNDLGGLSPGFANLPGAAMVTWDRQADTTDWTIPTPTGAAPSYLGLDRMSVSADNNLFLFTTFDEGYYAEGIVPSDGDGKPELVLYDRAANTIRKLSHLADSTNVVPYDGSGYQAFLSPDGSRAYFASRQTLLPSDTYDGPLSDADLYSIALK
jgi:hypothetical protein